MPAIFFQLSKNHEILLKRLMKDTGYTSKAEFFRFLLQYYEWQLDERLERVTKSLEKALIRMKKEGRIDPRPLKEQMKDLDDNDEF